MKIRKNVASAKTGKVDWALVGGGVLASRCPCVRLANTLLSLRPPAAAWLQAGRGICKSSQQRGEEFEVCRGLTLQCWTRWITISGMAGRSDADREKLRRERERVEKALAEERQRLARAAEQGSVDERLEEEHRRQFGPQYVMGPDDVRVRLAVGVTGRARFRRPPPSRRGPFGLGPNAAGLMGVYALIAIGQALMRSGFVLRIVVQASPYRYYRRWVRDEDAAAALFAAAKRAVEDGGVDQLRRRVLQ